MVELHRERYGRLDVLVNSGGLGIGAAAGEHQTKFIDMQFDVNVRAIIIFYRECLEMLRAAGAEHRSALVVNLASMAGKVPSPWLSVYSATKAAVLAYTQAMNKELNGDGIKSVALAPGFVDTDMSDFVKGTVPVEEMIRPVYVAEGGRASCSGSRRWRLSPRSSSGARGKRIQTRPPGRGRSAPRARVGRVRCPPHCALIRSWMRAASGAGTGARRRCRR